MEIDSEDKKIIGVISTILILYGLFTILVQFYGNIIPTLFMWTGLLEDKKNVIPAIFMVITVFFRIFAGGLFLFAGIRLWKSDTIKSVKSLVGTAILLIGTYDLIVSIYSIATVIPAFSLKSLYIYVLLNGILGLFSGLLLILIGTNLRKGKLKFNYLAGFVILFGIARLSFFLISTEAFSLSSDTAFRIVGGLGLAILGILLLRSKNPDVQKSVISGILAFMGIVYLGRIAGNLELLLKGAENDSINPIMLAKMETMNTYQEPLLWLLVFISVLLAISLFYLGHILYRTKVKEGSIFREGFELC